MSKELSFLESTSLGLSEWRALKAFTSSTDEFEPLAKREKIDTAVLGQLLKLGLTEAGPTCHRFDPEYGPTGYRLSSLGRRVLDRGPWAVRPGMARRNA